MCALALPSVNGTLSRLCCGEPTDTQSEARPTPYFRSTFQSKTGLKIEIVELSDSRFEDLVTMYEVFEPKRGAQGLPPVGRERIVTWLRHLQKDGYNLLALANSHVIGHSMLCPVDATCAEFAIFLDQGSRNQGIGTGLTAATLAYAEQLNFRNIWLSVETNNRCAVRVYRKTGFQLSGLFGPEQEMALELNDQSKGETSDASQDPSVARSIKNE